MLFHMQIIILLVFVVIYDLEMYHSIKSFATNINESVLILLYNKKILLIGKIKKKIFFRIHINFQIHYYKDVFENNKRQEERGHVSTIIFGNTINRFQVLELQ